MTDDTRSKLQLFPPPFVVSLDEGFSPEKDLFGRAPIAASLTRLLDSVDQPLVLALDGDWGTGKTTFLRFWTGELTKSGFPVVFFDAFENDYVDDPFVALAGDVYELVASHSDNRQAKAFASKAADVGKVLLRSGLKIGVKAATMGALSASDIDDLAASVSDEAATIVDEHIGGLITKRRDDQRTVAAFKAALQNLPEKLRSGVETKPLIIIIDELDRCRPAFALSLLERVKHLFSVPNVHFVLGINSTQLENSVSAVYGQGINSRLYLQKFIHLNWTLSRREQHASDKSRLKYANYLARNIGFQGKDAESMRSALVLVGQFAERQALSFRTIERVMSVITLAIATTPPNHFRAPALIVGLALMKVLEPRLFARAKEGTLSFEDVERFLGLNSNVAQDNNELEWSLRWWRFVTDHNAPEELIERMNQGLLSYHFYDRFDILSHTAESVMDDVLMR